LRTLEDETAPAAAVLGFEAQNPGNYGRLVIREDQTDQVERIVEARDANAQELGIQVCNSGLMAFDGSRLPDLLTAISPSLVSNELYLTDTVAAARAQGWPVKLAVTNEMEAHGVNTLHDLAVAEKVFQDRQRQLFLLSGVQMIDPNTVYFSFDTEISSDVVIEPGVVFGPGVKIEAGVCLKAYSVLAGCHIGADAQVGPFARVRPETELAPQSRIGNFVELKNTKLGEGAKANHLSYLGDATIAENVNIGAGTITVNYDGFAKHQTRIGAGSATGAHCALVAPLTIGANVVMGAGSTLTKDVPDEALVVARARQETYEGGAKRYRKKRKRA